MHSPENNQNATRNTAATADLVSVSLVRGAHRWVFRCTPGEEPILVRYLADLADQADCPLDRFDAALVTQHFNQKFVTGLHKVPADQENS